jgi:hypothetical protein
MRCVSFGWRRSGDRASLQRNSLQTGNLTANFAILWPMGIGHIDKTAALHAFLLEFPTKLSGNNFNRTGNSAATTGK